MEQRLIVEPRHAPVLGSQEKERNVPDFTRVINLAYERILGRPADPEGLSNYDDLMNAGLTEAGMREALLRSPEYAEKHPGPLASAARIRSKPKKTIRRASKKKGR